MGDIDSQIEAALFKAKYGPGLRPMSEAMQWRDEAFDGYITPTTIFRDVGVHHKNFTADINKAIREMTTCPRKEPTVAEIHNEPFFKSMIDRPGRYCPRCGRHKTAVSNGRCELCSPPAAFVNETVAALFPAKRTIESVVKTFTTSKNLSRLLALVAFTFILVNALIRYLGTR